MKHVMLSILIAAALTASALAQDRGAHAGSADLAIPTDPAIAPVQAPPSLNDPGTPAVSLPTPQVQVQSAVADSQAESTAKPPESPGLPADVQAAANAAELPVVTVRQQGTDTVEEYRKHGKLVFVRVLSHNGPTRYYVDSPTDVPATMQQLSGPSGVVQPVYYKLLEWK